MTSWCVVSQVCLVSRAVSSWAVPLPVHGASVKSVQCPMLLPWWRECCDKIRDDIGSNSAATLYIFIMWYQSVIYFLPPVPALSQSSFGSADHRSEGHGGYNLLFFSYYYKYLFRLLTDVINLLNNGCICSLVKGPLWGVPTIFLTYLLLWDKSISYVISNNHDLLFSKDLSKWNFGQEVESIRSPGTFMSHH